MHIPKITVVPRQESGSRSSRRQRAEGLVPSVLYGHRREARSFTIDSRTVEATLKAGARMVDLAWDKDGRRALIKDVQYDHMGDFLIHVDFQEIAMDEVIHLKVALSFEGVPKGLKEGGVTEHQMNDVEIQCLPGDIPEKIVINVSDLAIGDSIHLHQVVLPQGVSLLHAKDKDNLVVSVALPKVEAVPVADAAAAAAAEAPAGPEIISQKEREDREKARDESGGGGAAKPKAEKKA
jgi:large subunit ribosomal protein L25